MIEKYPEYGMCKSMCIISPSIRKKKQLPYHNLHSISFRAKKPMFMDNVTYKGMFPWSTGLLNWWCTCLACDSLQDFVGMWVVLSAFSSTLHHSEEATKHTLLLWICLKLKGVNNSVVKIAKVDFPIPHITMHVMTFSKVSCSLEDFFAVLAMTYMYVRVCVIIYGKSGIFVVEMFSQSCNTAKINATKHLHYWIIKEILFHKWFKPT